MRRLITGLGHLNEAILGSDLAGAYIMNVGLSMGAAIEAEYKQFWGIERPFTLDEYAHVIVDLKQKIQGNFSIVSIAPEAVVVRTTSCPFDAFVRQSPSLCFMTSSVFGGIAARNFGWSKVVLHKRIALGDPGCYVTVHLQRTPEAEAAVGREYSPDADQASPDIAEQLRLMDSVRQLRRRLGETSSQWTEVVDGAAEAIAVVDHDRRTSFANARWRDILGIEGGEFVGGQLVYQIHPDDQEAATAAFTQALGGERIRGCPWRMRHRDGSYRDLLGSIGPLRDDDGRIIGALLIARDMTAEHEAQRLKDDFVSAASHELRTPVTTIRALTDIMLRAVDRGATLDPDQLTRRLEIIRQQADRLTRLSTDLIDATQLQAGRLAVRRDPEDLIAAVEASVRQRRDLLEGNDRHRIALTHPPAPVFVALDRMRVEQVLDNLLDNAVKYSPAGGLVRVNVAVDQQAARVSISDDGIGVPAEDLPHLFEPFYRGANAPTHGFSGLGLGLYVSKALIEAHGGDIVVASDGRGTTFTLVLPLGQDRV